MNLKRIIQILVFIMPVFILMISARVSIRVRNDGANKLLIRLLKKDRIDKIYMSDRVLNTFLYKIATPSGLRLGKLRDLYCREIDLFERIYNITEAQVRHLKRIGTI